MTIEDQYQTDPLKACRRALRATVHSPWKDRLDDIDKLLGTYGTEAIRGEWQNDGYWCNVVAAYCNTGDSYALTVIHHRDRGFFVSSVGDFIESQSEGAIY